MARSNTKEAKERLSALRDHMKDRASGANWEIEGELTQILGLLGEDVEESIVDPVLESHLTKPQIEKVREAKRTGTFAGPDPNP